MVSDAMWRLGINEQASMRRIASSRAGAASVSGDDAMRVADR